MKEKGAALLYTHDGRDLIACDDPLCGAVVEVANADEDGWVVTRLSGPHFCPLGAEWRFRSLIGRAFGRPLA